MDGKQKSIPEQVADSLERIMAEAVLMDGRGMVAKTIAAAVIDLRNWAEQAAGEAGDQGKENETEE